MTKEQLKTLIDDLENLTNNLFDDYKITNYENTGIISKWDQLRKEVYALKLLYEVYLEYDEHQQALIDLNTKLDCLEYSNLIIERNKKLKHRINDQKTRFRKRLREMRHPYFITLTFTDEALDKDFRRIIREYLKKNDISFCFVSDYGTNGTKRFHYHGIIDIPDESDILMKSYSKNGKILRNSKNQVIYNIPYFTERLGWNGLTRLKVNTVSTKSTLNYIFKYIYKNPFREVFVSRSYKKIL